VADVPSFGEASALVGRACRVPVETLLRSPLHMLLTVILGLLIEIEIGDAVIKRLCRILEGLPALGPDGAVLQHATPRAERSRPAEPQPQSASAPAAPETGRTAGGTEPGLPPRATAAIIPFPTASPDRPAHTATGTDPPRTTWSRPAGFPPEPMHAYFVTISKH
jgi:hypothetical protein